MMTKVCNHHKVYMEDAASGKGTTKWHCTMCGAEGTGQYKFSDVKYKNMKYIHGMNDAIIGTAESSGRKEVLLYDLDRLLSIAMKDNNWTRETALEWYTEEISNWGGDGAPIFAMLDSNTRKDI